MTKNQPPRPTPATVFAAQQARLIREAQAKGVRITKKEK